MGDQLAVGRKVTRLEPNGTIRKGWTATIVYIVPRPAGEPPHAFDTFIVEYGGERIVYFRNELAVLNGE